jgi:nucleotide-binding universal stress UspA family protein
MRYLDLCTAAPPWHHFALQNTVAIAGRGGGPRETMSRKRRSYEAGHQAKFLVVVDDTPECDRALYFASRRAARVGIGVIMLRVIDTHDRNQQWLGVADIMRAEAHEEAQQMLARAAGRANGIAGVTPEQVIREGDTAEQILKLIDEDEDISVLVLAAGVGSEGPGPLVASLGTTAGTFPIPMAIVPGHLSDEDLDAMS